MPVSNRRISRLVLDAKAPLADLRMRKVDLPQLLKAVEHFRALFEKASPRYRRLNSGLILNAKAMRVEHSLETIRAIRGLLASIARRLGGEGRVRLSRDCRRSHLARQSLPLHPETQVTVLASEGRRLEACRKRIARKVQQDLRVCQLLQEGVWTPSQVSKMACVPRWKVYQLKKAQGNRQEGFRRLLAALERQTEILIGVEAALQPHNYAVRSGLELLGELGQRRPEIGIRRPELYWALKATGLRVKKAVERRTASPELLQSRITFFQNWAQCGSDRRFFMVFFDWTSFCPGNFKQMGWALRGKKSLIPGRYVYSALHLLAVMSEERIEGFQLAQGNLSSDLVFNFLTGCLVPILERLEQEGRRLVVVLDNSPLNFGEALRHFCLYHRVTLLYTAPRSSFQNPIEMLFALLKLPLKRVYSASKFP